MCGLLSTFVRLASVCRIRGNCVLNSASIGVSFFLEEIAIGDAVDVYVDIVEDMEREDAGRFEGLHYLCVMTRCASTY